jgi:NAD(P)-dependent dehydrogenase (short-subunit alcohol dehydrogenase family)
MRDLSGKIAVVTGAGSGIGRALARELAARGAVVAAADLNPTAAKETVAGLPGPAGDRASAHPVDVADETQMRALVDAVIGRHGQVDIVVNNAGISTAPVPVLETPLSTYRTVMAVNFWGVVHGSLLFLPHLVQRPAANLVNVASFAGLIGISKMSPYVASKFGVRGFTESLRMELSAGPVAVTLVCPGGTKTSLMMNSPVVDPDRREAMHRQLAASGQAKSPESVARVIVRAIEHDRGRVLIGPDSKLLDAIVRVIPGAYPPLLRRGVEAMFAKALG